MLYRGTAGDGCAAFFKEAFRLRSWREISKISCAAIFVHFLISVFAVVLKARKSKPADRWRETILRKLLRPDPDSAKRPRYLAGCAPPILAVTTLVFRQA